MKRFVINGAGALLFTALVVVGCGRKHVSTSELRDNFQSAEPATKTLAEKAVSDIKSNNYAQALTDLQQLGHKAKLSPDQQQAIQDTVTNVQQRMTEIAHQPPAASGSTTNSKSFWGWLKSLKH